MPLTVAFHDLVTLGARVQPHRTVLARTTYDEDSSPRYIGTRLKLQERQFTKCEPEEADDQSSHDMQNSNTNSLAVIMWSRRPEGIHRLRQADLMFGNAPPKQPVVSHMLPIVTQAERTRQLALVMQSLDTICIVCLACATLPCTTFLPMLLLVSFLDLGQAKVDTALPHRRT